MLFLPSLPNLVKKKRDIGLVFSISIEKFDEMYLSNC